jgi:ribosome-associated translation inhibitor RaiA
VQVEIHTKSVRLDESLRTHIERRLASAIGRFDELIRHVKVHLAPRDGPRRQDLKECRICVALEPAGHVAIVDQGKELYALTASAAARVSLAVINELWRRRESAKQQASAS